MRVLLSTHSAATRTSFGIVCRQIWTRIQRADPSIEILQHGWLHHPAVEDVPWEVIPTDCPRLDAPGVGRERLHLDDQYGDVTFGGVLDAVRPHVVWHLGDPYMGSAVARCRPGGGYRLVHYYPVAEEPFNHFDEAGVEKLVRADALVAATQFGAAVLASVPPLAGRRIPSIPHGVDTRTFFPRSAGARAALRTKIGGSTIDPNMFILGWVGHDQARKQVWVLYELMYYLRSGNWVRCRRCGRVTVKEYDHRLRRLRDVRRLRTYESGFDYRTCWYCRSKDVERGKPRDNVVLWTVMDNNLAVGYDLRMLAHMYRVGDVVFDSSSTRGEAGHTFEEMSQVYSCFDALVYPSGAEGFGMPVLEAMACGVPAVYSNYSGHAEYAVGLPVRVRFAPDRPHPSMLGLVDMGDLLRNVLRIIDDAPLRARLSEEAHRRAQGMDWDRFTPRWLELLRGLE